MNAEQEETEENYRPTAPAETNGLEKNGPDESSLTEIFELQSASELETIILEFQAKFPFHKIHIDAFMQIIFSLNKEAFSVDELKHHFADWEYEDEDVFKLIQQLPDTDGMGFIDIYSMICLGILWCAGDIV